MGNFDGRHYIEIATKGYENTNFAFFPLYPVLIFLFGKIIPIDHLYIGLLLSGLFMSLGMLMLYTIVRLDYSKKVAVYTLISYAFLPFSFFYHSVYTDSLFFFLATASFYFARQKLWLTSGIFAGLSFFDRFTGIALLPALALEWYLQYNHYYKDLSSKLKSFLGTAMLAILLGVLGFLIYLIYLELVHGNFLLFQQARSAWSSDKFVFPLQTLYRYIRIFLNVSPYLFEYWITVLEFTSFWIYLAIACYVIARIRLSYGIFMFLLLLIVPSTVTLAGNPRYLLHLFGGFIVLGLWLSRYVWFRFFYAAMSLVLGFVLTALFTRGYFIT